MRKLIDISVVILSAAVLISGVLVLRNTLITHVEKLEAATHTNIYDGNFFLIPVILYIALIIAASIYMIVYFVKDWIIIIECDFLLNVINLQYNENFIELVNPIDIKDKDVPVLEKGFGIAIVILSAAGLIYFMLDLRNAVMNYVKNMEAVIGANIYDGDFLLIPVILYIAVVVAGSIYMIIYLTKDWERAGHPMSFTIKCDKCGTEQVFKDRTNMMQKDVEIEVTENYFGLVTGISIICCGSDCSNVIDLKH